MKKLLPMVLMLSMIPTVMSAANTIGYSDGTVGRATIFRTETAHTGLAVRIPAEKLRLLAGLKINAIDLAIGSQKSNDGNISVFIAESLEGTPLVKETKEIVAANKWVTYTLSAPYEITGLEDELYIGYTLDIPKTYEPLSADMSSPIEDITYALFDTEWRDVCDMNVGQGNVRAVLDADPKTVDLMLKPLKMNGYYRQGESYSFSGNIFNFGTTAVEKFKISLKIGSAAPQIYDIEEVIEPAGAYVFNIPDYVAEESGELDVKLEILEADGAVDNDPGDNGQEAKLFFYPNDMERALLLENFTGQACSQCPAGHTAIESALENWNSKEGNPEVIMVSHHSGYYPDSFTMKEDMEYTSLYPGSTYAPAFMVNRMSFGTQTAPVSGTGVAVVTEALEYASATMPYVALNLETSFDAAARKLDVKVKANTFNEIPEDIRTINVMLCQNNIIANQSGMGSQYIHDHVFRGALTGNAWGIQKPFKAGTSEEYEVSYVIPESIHASYYKESEDCEYDIPAVPENMYVVAYVAVYDKDNTSKRYILNCAAAKLGENKMQGGFAGVEDVESHVVTPAIRIVDGKATVDADCQSIEVYNLAGMRIDNDNLPCGLYVVRAVTADGVVAAAKVIAK